MSSPLFSQVAIIIVIIFLEKGIHCASNPCQKWVDRKRSLIAIGEVGGDRLLLLDDHYSGLLLPLSALVHVDGTMFKSGAPPPYLSFEQAEVFRLSGTENLPPRTIPTGAVILANEHLPNYYLRYCVGLLSDDGQSFALLPVERSLDEDVSADAVYLPITENGGSFTTRIFTSAVREDNSSMILSALYNAQNLNMFKLQLHRNSVESTFVKSKLFLHHYRQIDGGFFYQNATLLGFHNGDAMIKIWNVEMGPESVEVLYKDFFKCDTLFLAYNQMVTTLIWTTVLGALFILWIVFRCQGVSCFGGCGSFTFSSNSSQGDSFSSRKSTAVSRQLLTMKTSGASASKTTSTSAGGGASRKLTTPAHSKLTSSGSTFTT